MIKKRYLKEKIKYLKLKGGLIEPHSILTKILSIGFEFESTNLFGMLKKKDDPYTVRNLNETSRKITVNVETILTHNNPENKIIIQYDEGNPHATNINATLNLNNCLNKTDQNIIDTVEDYTIMPTNPKSILSINKNFIYNQYTNDAIKNNILDTNNKYINIDIDLLDNCMTGVRNCEFTYTIRQENLLAGNRSSNLRRDNIILEGLKEALDAIYTIFYNSDENKGVLYGKIINIHKQSNILADNNKCRYKTVSIPPDNTDLPIYITDYNEEYYILFANTIQMTNYSNLDLTNQVNVNGFGRLIINNANFTIQTTFSVELDDLFDVMNYLYKSNKSTEKESFTDKYNTIYRNIIKNRIYIPKDQKNLIENKKNLIENINKFNEYYNNKNYIDILIIIFIYLFITYLIFKLNSEYRYLKELRPFQIRNSFKNIFFHIINKNCTALDNQYNYDNFIDNILNNIYFRDRLYIESKTKYKNKNNLTQDVFDELYTDIVNYIKDEDNIDIEDIEENSYFLADSYSSIYNNHDIILVEFRLFYTDELFDANILFYQLHKKLHDKLCYKHKQADNLIYEQVVQNNLVNENELIITSIL